MGATARFSLTALRFSKRLNQSETIEFNQRPGSLFASVLFGLCKILALLW